MTTLTTIIKYDLADSAGVVGQQPFKAKAKFDKLNNWILDDKLNQIIRYSTTVVNDEHAQANIQIHREIYLPFLTPFYGIICGRSQTPSNMTVEVCEIAHHLTRRIFTNDGEKRLNYTDVNWMDPLWLHRRKMIVTKTKVADEVKDYPMLINIPANTSFANNAQANGDDFVVTAKDGITVIPHEIEYFNSTTGALVLWCKAPKVSDTSNFEFYIYYNNAAALNQEDIINVWKGCYTIDGATTITDWDYSAVWHLHADSLDSTENNNDGADTGITYVIGHIGNAASFDALNSKINLGSGTTIDNVFAANGLLSAWIYPNSDGEGSVGLVLDKVNYRLITQDESAGFVRLRFEQTWDTSVTTSKWDTAVDIPIATWTKVDIVYDRSSAANNPTIYINGVARTVDLGTLTETTAPGTTADSDAASDLIIGNNIGQTATFDGKIDEIRMIKIPPADISHIIITLYNAQSDNPTFVFLLDHEEYKKAANAMAQDILDSANSDMPFTWVLDQDFPTGVLTAAFPLKNHFEALHIIGESLALDVWFDNKAHIVFMGTKGKTILEELDITITSNPEISIDNYTNNLNIIGKKDDITTKQITDYITSLTTVRYNYESVVSNNQLVDDAQLTSVGTALLSEFNKLTPSIKGEVPYAQFTKYNLKSGDIVPIYQPDKQVKGQFRIMDIKASPQSVKLSFESTETGVIRLRSVSLTGVIEGILRKIQNQSID